MQLSGEENTPRTWVKSSYSMTNGNCVEVAELPSRAIGVRDSQNRQGGALWFSPGEWDLFVGILRHDGFA